MVYPVSRINGVIQSDNEIPNINISPRHITETSPLSPTVNHLIGNMVQPSTSKPRTKTAKGHISKPLLSPSNYHSLNPSADLKLPAEIFASDDSISDTGLTNSEDLHNVLNELADDSMVSTKDKMLGGINIKVEKLDPPKSKKKSKNNKDVPTATPNLNLADIKTELQDDFDWNNMTLATLNSNNRLQSR